MPGCGGREGEPPFTNSGTPLGRVSLHLVAYTRSTLVRVSDTPRRMFDGQREARRRQDGRKRAEGVNLHCACGAVLARGLTAAGIPETQRFGVVGEHTRHTGLLGIVGAPRPPVEQWRCRRCGQAHHHSLERLRKAVEAAAPDRAAIESAKDGRLLLRRTRERVA
jgi:hypothetical protein